MVIDVEVRSDDVACRLARRISRPNTRHLREIVCVSCLSWNSQEGGDWSLCSFHRDDMSESDILENAHRLASNALSKGAVLVSFNGVSHDLPVLRGRQLRWWHCDRGAFGDYLTGRGEHVDVMLSLAHSGRTLPALTDACAAIGIPLHGPIRMEADRTIPIEREKCERDVVGTAILYFYVLADAQRSNQPLSSGLPDLGKFLRELAVFNPHLRALATNPAMLGPSGAWGARATA